MYRFTPRVWRYPRPFAGRQVGASASGPACNSQSGWAEIAGARHRAGKPSPVGRDVLRPYAGQDCVRRGSSPGAEALAA